MAKKKYKLPISGWDSPLGRLRRERNLTQQQVVDETNKAFDLTSYRPWEHSEVYPSTENLIVLADYFNVSTDYILGRTNFRNIGNKEISFITGLSEKSIEALRFFNSTVADPEDAEAHRKNIDFINKALEDVWENIVKYETSPDNHAPVKSIFYTMMQFLLSDNSELHCREGDEYRVISSKIASFDIDGDTTGYTISEISRELIMKHIEKWLNNTREEVQ